MTKRNILTCLTALIATLAVCSCQMETEAPFGSRTITIKASIDKETKTAYEAEKAFSWVKGDKIAIVADRSGSDVLVMLEADEAGACVSFSGEGQEGDTPGQNAFYPETFASIDGGVLSLSLPESFTPDAENPLSVIPLIGTRTSGRNYSFLTAAAILKVTVTDIPADATALVLSHSSDDVVLSGSFSLPEGDALVPACAVAKHNSVSILFTPAAEGESRGFYFPLPVSTLPAGLKLTLKRSSWEDVDLGITVSPVELYRNRIVNVGSLSEKTAEAEGVGMLKAYLGEPTKTSWTSTDGFSWVVGDEIDAVVCQDGTFTSRRYVSLDEGQEARFLLATGQEDKEGLSLKGWAFYPSRESESAQDGGYALQWDIRPSYYESDKTQYPGETEIITIDLPAVQALRKSNPMGVLPHMGVRQEDLRYKFTPMTALVKVMVTTMEEGLDYISLSATDAAISGSFHLNQETGAISQQSVISANPAGLTLNFSELGDRYTFFFPVPAGSLSGSFTVNVGCSRNPEDAMEYSFQAPATLAPGEIFDAGVLVFEPKDQQWARYADAEFLDDFIWSKHSAFTSGVSVPVEIQRSGLHPEKYRIANPYTAACTQFGYTPYANGIKADDYLVFSIADDGMVHFNPFLLGVEDKDSDGRAMMITHPCDWSSSRKGTYNKVVSTLQDGTPLEIELAAVYSDPDDSGYFYSRDGEGSNDASRIHIVIEDNTPETWNPVAEGEFIDDLLWPYHSWGTTRVQVSLEQSSKVPSKLRVANPYVKAAGQFGYTPYTSGIEASGYIELTLLDGNLVRFATFLAGIEDKASGGKPMKVWYPTDWGGSYDVSYNKVNSWRSDGLPAEIQLAAVYSDPVTVSYKYTKNTVPTIHFWFPESDPVVPQENWSEAGTVRYRDLFTFTDCPYASVKMDRSDLGRYRIANPYPVLAGLAGEEVKYEADEYLFLTVADNGLIDFDPLKTGLERYNWDFSLSHPSEIGKNVNYNKVLEYDGEGNPLILQLAPIYHQTGAIESGNKYSRDTYDNMVRILMPGVPDKSGLAVVSHVQYPLFAGEERQIMEIEHPAGTVESFTVSCDHPELVKEYAIKDNKNIYVTMADGPYAALPSVRFTLTEITVGGASVEIEDANPQPHFLGVKLRTGGYSGDTVTGDDGVASYRIPALVTSRKGTLIAAYDCRWKNSTDLQGDIDVGVSRSLDGGKTWEPMIIAMDMGEWGGLGQELNGIGDPCLLVDESTGRIFCFAVWAHNHGGAKCINWAGSGFDPEDTPQLMMATSDDDGITWSAPVNITRQVKRYDWWMTFQGPGRGITMKDGTLVVPIQHQEGSRSLNAGIMYSTDHGRTWHTHSIARAITSESCVAEIEPGVLLLSMRDETNSKVRAAYVTRDLGRTWTPHVSDAKMIEPTCEASMIHVDAAGNGTGKDLLIFSNPHSQSARKMVTIQVSMDGGATWPYSALLDNGGWQGYSCLTMIDENTVGIVHESFSNSIIFQAVPLADIVVE